MQLTLLVLGVMLWLAVAIVLGYRWWQLRKGESFKSRLPLTPVVESWIDFLAFNIVTGARKLFRYIYLSIILLGEELIKLFKKIIIKIEKRFDRIVSQVKGRADISKKGSVSLFLKEIKEHQQNIKKELN